MFKYFKREVAAGPSEAYWAREFAAIRLDEARRMCEASPLWPLFERTLRPDRLFIDGGCGGGQWVKYYGARGFPAAGVDFSEDLVAQIRAQDPELDVRHGDVRSLPFGDGEVHTYYSGGVVEHFEDGPEEALREAHRVLADDGTLLCTVPDASLLRRNLFYRRYGRAALRPTMDVAEVERTERGPAPPGMSFHQYVFTRAEFEARLERCGFEVIETVGHAWVWSLFDVRGVQTAYEGAVRAGRLAKRWLGGRGDSAGSGLDAGASETGSPNGERPQVGLLGRFLVREDPETPVLGSVTKVLAEQVPHMRMYVARKRC